MASTSKPWADTPFTLIALPSKGQDINKLHGAIYVASEMACAHNGMLRSLNSIYQQCMYVSKPQDIRDLLQYCKFWCHWLEEHHEGEEEILFPDIEKVTGIEKMMDEMVTQHKDFLPGLGAFEKFVNETTAETYDGKALRKIIDDFGLVLMKHLTEEVELLASLTVHDGPKLKKAYLDFDQKQKAADKWIMGPLVLGVSDGTWPWLPGVVKFACHYVLERKYQGAWRFNPCTTWGQPRPLLFTAETKQ